MSEKQPTIGLVAEYNPLHNGHVAQIEQLRKKYPACSIIVILSSYFCQRGIPAILPPQARAETAIRAGADLVLKLPTLFAAATAEQFASAAVKILQALPKIDFLAFGLEDISDLTKIKLATAVELAGDNNELEYLYLAQSIWPEISSFVTTDLGDKIINFPELLKLRLKSGKNYPEARLDVLSELIGDPELAIILKQSNTILAMGYLNELLVGCLKRADWQRSKITRILATDRQGAAELDDSLASDTQASASGIRRYLTARDELRPSEVIAKLHNQLPPYSLAELLNDRRWPELSNYAGSIAELILRASLEDLQSIRDWQGGLAERAFKIRETDLLYKSPAVLESLIGALSERAFPRTRIQRALLALYLNIKEQDFIAYGERPLFAQALAFNKRGKDYLRRSRKHFGLALVSRFSELHSRDSKALDYQMTIERRAAQLYFHSSEKGHADLLQHALYLSKTKLN